MAGKPKLNPKILQYLHEQLDRDPSNINSAISVLNRKYPLVPRNAVAQIYAEKHGLSVRRLIPKEDKPLIPVLSPEKPTTAKVKHGSKHKEPAKTILQVTTTDPFLQKHVAEINRAYNKRCYTCVFVLTRKVFENLIVGILRTKYPKDPGLYWDSKKNRYLDFSIVLANLYTKRKDFDDKRRGAIDRLHQKLKPFKDDANKKTHSLYHIVENQQEINDWNLDTIMDLINDIG